MANVNLDDYEVGKILYFPVGTEFKLVCVDEHGQKYLKTLKQDEVDVFGRLSEPNTHET